jgi:DNA-binding SARP family transcriptional activator
VLGGVAVTVDGVDLALSGQAQRVVGILLAERERPVSTDLFVERLWPHDPPATAAKIVHVLIGRLRKALEPGLERAAEATVIRKVGRGYQLTSGVTDLDRYLELADAAAAERSARPTEALLLATSALDTWTGRPWGAQADELWLVDRVAALEEAHRRTEELWADLALECGRAETAIDRFRAAATREPLRERRWAQLALALYRADRQGEALRELDRARVLLREELGIGLSEELGRLEVAILQHDPSLAAGVARSEAVARTSFVGRVDDLHRLSRALDRERLVTVVGLGGVGKSRLATEYAQRRRLVGDRTWHVTFAGGATTAGVAQQVCDQLGLLVEDHSSAKDLVAAAIGNRDGLLVLDGAEHVADDIGVFLLRLLDECPLVRVLVTSRTSLGLGADPTIDLAPLPVPGPDDPIDGTALELLLDRAGLDVHDIDARRLASLRAACDATAGVPMLVELASRILETSSDRAAPADVRSESHAAAVDDAISTSMELVDDMARELLFDAAALPGGVSEESAAHLLAVEPAVARRALRQLAWLHLVEVEAGDASLRYRSLDPIRESLQARRSHDQRAVSMHRATSTMFEVLARLKPSRAEPTNALQLDVVADEHDNLRRILTEQLASDPHVALELAIAAAEFWAIRGMATVANGALLAAADAVLPTGELAWRTVCARARITRTMADTASMRADLERVCQEMAVSEADPTLYGMGLAYLAVARGWSGDRDGASAALDTAESLDRDLGNPWSRSHLAHLRSLDHALAGDFEAAREGQRMFVAEMIELDDPASAATGAYLAVALGDMAGRVDLYDDIDQARFLANAVKDPIVLGQVLLLEARVLRRSGDSRARAAFETAIVDLEAKGVLRPSALARRDLGLLALAEGDWSGAQQLLSTALPVLLKLDRSAAALACAGLGALAAVREQRARAERLAGVAHELLRATAPTSNEDRQRVPELLVGIEVPTIAVPSDTEIVELAKPTNAG